MSYAAGCRHSLNISPQRHLCQLGTLIETTKCVFIEAKPTAVCNSHTREASTKRNAHLVGLGGFEPPTSPLSGVRSNQLSYRPLLTCLLLPWPRCLSRLVGHVLNAHSLLTSTNALPDQQHPTLKDHRACTAQRQPRSQQLIRFQQPVRQRQVCEHLMPVSISFKEVIQPQVPLGLPCYDFTPVMNHSVVIALPKVRLTTSGATHSHGVTGGVYKARERIHRDILIRDY